VNISNNQNSSDSIINLTNKPIFSISQQNILKKIVCRILSRLPPKNVENLKLKFIIIIQMVCDVRGVN